MIRTWNLFSVSCLILSVFVLSGTSQAAAGMLSNGISLGYIKAGSAEVAAMAWRPDFKLGPLAVGLDVNIPMGENKPQGYESVVFRYAEYNDGQKGLRYGMLDGVTWGRGLLMKNYSTRTAGPIVQNNQQTAFKGFVNADRVGVQVLSTWSHIYAFRLTEKVNPMLTLGQSYISAPTAKGAALDASVPLPLNFEGYAEAATLFNHGTGAGVGITWGMEALIFSAALDVGYRSIDNKFVPGYWSADYETNPVNLASYEASGRNKNGYIAELRLLAANLLKLDALYESYNGSNAALTGNAVAELDRITLGAYFKQPDFQDFRSLSIEQGAIVGYSLGYKINPNTLLVGNYKKAYDPALGRVVESQYYEVRLVI
jgi:hypothetical protein